jgi:hypothetical protein
VLLQQQRGPLQQQLLLMRLMRGQVIVQALTLVQANIASSSRMWQQQQQERRCSK